MIAKGNRVALVTGAADGIGLGISRSFAEAGDRVGMLDVNVARLDVSVGRLRQEGAIVSAHYVDVRDAQAVDEAVAEVTFQHGAVDVAVSNAAIAPNSAVVDMGDEEWERVIGINLTGSFNVMRGAARVMVQQNNGGKICCIGSGVHRSARRGASHYAASKAGVVMLAKTLALELAGHDIQVNVVSPGFVNHGFREGLGNFVTPEYLEAIMRHIPVGRTGTVDDIVVAVRFACSRDTNWLTGVVIEVDGGSSAGRFSLPSSGPS